MTKLAITLASLGTSLVLSLPLIAFGQQQAPSQHSPSTKDYRELPPSVDDFQGETIRSQVTLTWHHLPNALRYTIRISRLSDMSSLVDQADAVTHRYITPPLPPGVYFYDIEGFRYEKSVGRHPVKRFVVGAPLNVNGQQRLQAPQIIAPKHMQMFPSYGKVRLAWQSVPGARGYRFRLWEEDKIKENQRWKRETMPRWVTEVHEPWIEVHDAPYTSYMYLDTGVYRWDVAAIDKNGGYVGDPAMGYFEMSRQWYLRYPEMYLRFLFYYAPVADYSSFAATTSQEFTKSNKSLLSYQTDLDVFFLRHWGINVGGGVTSIGGRTDLPDTIDVFNANIDLLFRWRLSINPYGWTLFFNGGLAAREFAVVDNPTTQIENLHIERPRTLGPRLGFRLYRNWTRKWEGQLLGNYNFHTWWIGSALSSPADLRQSVDGDLTARFWYHFTPYFSVGSGLMGEYRKIRYSPGASFGESSAKISGLSIFLTGEFHY